MDRIARMAEDAGSTRLPASLRLAQLLRALPDFPGRDTLTSLLVRRGGRPDALLRGSYGGGLRFEGNVARDGNVSELLLLRFSRPSLAPVLDAALSPGDVFADVGANNGLYTLWAARRVGPSGQVHAFEPLPDVRERLARNLELNGFRNVELIGSAVGAEPATITLRRADDASGRTSQYLREGSASFTTNVVKLDDHFRGAHPPDLIKIDVEGMELQVLRGALGLLEAERAPAIVFEAVAAQLALAGASYAGILALLAAHGGYRVFALTPRGLRAEAPDAAEAGSLNVLALRPGLAAHERIRQSLSRARFEANQNA
jgi:FkbM family methyltransferase